MAEHQADLPDKYILGDSWGLGWIRFGWDGHRLIGHDGNTIGQAAFLRLLPEAGPRGHAAHQRRQHPRPLRGPLPRDLRRARRRRDAGTPLAPPDGAGRRRHHAVRRHLRARRRADGGRSTATTARCCGPRSSPARWPSWCPTRSRSTRWSRSARRCSLVRPPEARDLGAGDVLRAADRRALPALRRPGHAAGGLMDLDRSCSPTSASWSSASRPRPTSPRSPASADVVARVGARRLGVAPERIVLDGRTHLRWRLGSRPVPGAAARPPRHGVAARLAGHPPVHGRRRRAARARLLRHEGRRW